MLNAVYNMLVNYVNPSREQPFDIQDGDILYYNNDEDDSKPRPGRACGQGQSGCRIKVDVMHMAVDVPHLVWYNPDGAANILSLFNVLKSYRVTMDTRCNQAIQVHMKDRSPTRNGLWVHHISNPQYVQDMWSMLSAVSEKKQLYTKRAYTHAVLARRLQNIIMHPSTQKLIKWEIALLQRLISRPQYSNRIHTYQQVSIQYLEIYLIYIAT
jgi:hypothetical protein